MCASDSSYKSATQQLQKWEATLNAVSQWDGTESALANPVETQSLSEETYDTVFKHCINDVFFSQQVLIPEAYQVSFLKPEGLFRSENNEPIQQESMATVAGYFSRDDVDDLEKLLDEEVFSVPAVRIIMSLSHACAIRYDKEEREWFFYNPNNPKGEIAYLSKQALIRAIFEVLGHALLIEVAGWHKTDADIIQRLTAAYQTLCEEKIVDLVRGDGLFLIAKKLVAEEQISKGKVLFHIENWSERMASLLRHFYREATDGQVFLKTVITSILLDESALKEKIERMSVSENVDAIAALVVVILTNDLFAAKDKKELFGLLNNRLLEKGVSLLQKKIAMLECIEYYIESRTVNTLVGIVKEIKTQGVGFFNTTGIKEITEKKIASAIKLETALLRAPDSTAITKLIEDADTENKKNSGRFHAGTYGDCLSDCRALLENSRQQSLSTKK